eukprot:COSAG02_NODE_1903_length_10446_cov_7.109307_7_plen_84_part_00
MCVEHCTAIPAAAAERGTSHCGSAEVGTTRAASIDVARTPCEQSGWRHRDATLRARATTAATPAAAANTKREPCMQLDLNFTF